MINRGAPAHHDAGTEARASLQVSDYGMAVARLHQLRTNYHWPELFPVGYMPDGSENVFGLLSE